MQKKSSVAFFMAVVFSVFSLAVQADDVSVKGRAIGDKNKDAVVTIQLVVKQKFSFPGSPSQDSESKVESTGTVISADGITVASLSEIDPTSVIEAMMAGNPQMQGMKMETEIQDAKLLLSDGSEVPAEIILRDKDLDMAFVRPVTKPETPMTFVDMSKSGEALQLDQVVSINRLGKVARRAHSYSIERIEAIVQKPRTFYIPGNAQTNTGLCTPAFNLDGDPIGVFLVRAIKDSSGGGMFGGGDSNVLVILLPAIDIQEAVAQAPPYK